MEEEEHNYDSGYEEEEESLSTNEMHITAKKNGDTRLSTWRYCREVLLGDMRRRLNPEEEYSFLLDYPKVESAALRVAPRYGLDVRVSKGAVTFTTTPETAFRYIWWVVGLTRGGYDGRYSDDDDVIATTVAGMKPRERRQFMTIARLWLDKRAEDELGVFSGTENGLCSAYNAKHLPRLTFLWSKNILYYRTPQEFAAFHQSMPKTAYVNKLGSNANLAICVAQLQKAMPQFRFWTSQKYGGIGISLRSEDQSNEELRTAAFWAFVLLNGDGFLEDGFGIPLSEKQKRTAKEMFGSAVNHFGITGHIFMVGRRE